MKYIDGYLEVGDNKKAFYYNHETGRVRLLTNIIDSEEYYTELFTQKTKYYKCLTGRTSNNQCVTFFECKCSGNIISTTGYCIADVEKPSDILFERISFYGNCIDNFYNPKNALNLEREDDVENTTIRLNNRSKEEYTHIYSGQYEGRKFDIIVSVDWKFRVSPIKQLRELGEFKSQFCLKFHETQNVEIIIDIYQWVFDFFRFTNYRQNISFDEIVLTTDKSKLGFVFFHTISESENYSRMPNEVITHEDIADNLSNTFTTIAKRRPNGIIDQIFIPKDNIDFKYFHHIKFLECALSFEGEYERAGLEKKVEINDVYARAQTQISELIDQLHYEDILVLEDDLIKILEKRINSVLLSQVKSLNDSPEFTGKKKRSFKKHLKRLATEIEHKDYTLAESFEIAYKKYELCLDDYFSLLKRRLDCHELTISEISEYFGSFRNSIGHGSNAHITNPIKISYMLGQALIYVLILGEIGLSNEIIKIIIKKIFYTN